VNGIPPWFGQVFGFAVTLCAVVFLNRWQIRALETSAHTLSEKFEELRDKVDERFNDFQRQITALREIVIAYRAEREAIERLRGKGV